MPEVNFYVANDGPTAPLMAKSWLALQIASVLHAASVVGRAHDASSKGKTRPLSSKDTIASSVPALEIIAFAAQPGTGRLKSVSV